MRNQVKIEVEDQSEEPTLSLGNQVKHAYAFHGFSLQDRKAFCYPGYLGFHLRLERSFSRLLFGRKIFLSLDIFSGKTRFDKTTVF